MEVRGVCSLILEENVEEINLNYKDKASLESGSGNGYTGKGSTGSRRYGSCCFGLSGFFFFFYSLPLRMRRPLSIPSATHLSVTHPLEGLLVRVAPVGTVGSLLCSLYSRVTDSRCLGFQGNIRSSSPNKETKKKKTTYLISLQTRHILQINRKAVCVSSEPKWILHRGTRPLDFSLLLIQTQKQIN